MQKFTREITREIDVAGNRLALNLGENGVSVRIVGMRRAMETSWATLICHMAGQSPRDKNAPTVEELNAAVETIKESAVPKPVATAPATAAAESPPPGDPSIPGPAVGPVVHPDNIEDPL